MSSQLKLRQYSGAFFMTILYVMRGEPQKTPQISSSLPVQEINSRSDNKLAQKNISFIVL